MRRSYNLEVRVADLEELATVNGYAGKRVLVLDSGCFYYWNSAWIMENGGIDYLRYSCQLFQSDMVNPYDNVLGTHTLSDFIVWERLDVGVYRGTLEGAFPALKTQFLHSGFVANVNTSPSSPGFVNIIRADDDTIIVTAYDNTLTPVDGLSGYDLEIRVYSTNNVRD